MAVHLASLSETTVSALVIFFELSMVSRSWIDGDLVLHAHGVDPISLERSIV